MNFNNCPNGSRPTTRHAEPWTIILDLDPRLQAKIPNTITFSCGVAVPSFYPAPFSLPLSLSLRSDHNPSPVEFLTPPDTINMETKKLIRCFSPSSSAWQCSSTSARDLPSRQVSFVQSKKTKSARYFSNQHLKNLHLNNQSILISYLFSSFCLIRVYGLLSTTTTQENNWPRVPLLRRLRWLVSCPFPSPLVWVSWSKPTVLAISLAAI